MEVVTMTVEGGRIRCDAYGCQTEGLIDLPTLSLDASAVTPYDVRGWFAMEGWLIMLGPGGTEGLVDHCAMHQREDAAVKGAELIV